MSNERRMLRKALGINPGQQESKAEEAVRAKLKPLLESGHCSLEQHEREVSFALGLSESKRADFIALRFRWAKEADQGMAQELCQLRAAAGIKV